MLITLALPCLVAPLLETIKPATITGGGFETAARSAMKEETSNSNDEKLSALLRESRETRTLPPRFSEGVWRRIENSQTPVRASRNWIEALAVRTLRPRFAFAVALVLVCAGSIFGAQQGHQAARHNMETRYLSSVAPNSLR